MDPQCVEIRGRRRVQIALERAAQVLRRIAGDAVHSLDPLSVPRRILHLLEQIVHPRQELLLFLQRISEKQLEHGDQYELELRVIVVLIIIWYKDIGLQHMTGEFEVLLMQIDFDRRLRAGQIAKHRTWPDKCGGLIPQLV